MRVLILGGAGMLGHRLWIALRDRFETYVTIRGESSSYASFRLFDANRTISRVEVVDFDTVVRAVAATKPSVVVNCVGIVKQLEDAKNPILSLTVNALFPHRLSELCEAAGSRLIHVSTDCVFSGRTGNYRETDMPDPEDLYGRTKLLGEVVGEHNLTVRTSVIGRELHTRQGLTEWLLSNRGKRVRGYQHAIFNGLTTHALAGVIGGVIEQHAALSGLYHVSSEPISKYDLLVRLNEALQANIEVEPVAEPRIDRSLDSARFWGTTGLTRPQWSAMLPEMAADSPTYEQWRRTGVS
jgi:dTDP-4-dehydrorhamnose reductase